MNSWYVGCKNAGGSGGTGPGGIKGSGVDRRREGGIRRSGDRGGGVSGN